MPSNPRALENKAPQLERLLYFFLLAALAAVYVRGLWVPLMDLDAAHHACIALHMHRSGDYFSLIDRGADYLDKPHFLFWTAALGFKWFGVGPVAYKFGSLLFSILGIYATYRLGRRLYGDGVGRTSALVLATSYAFVLSNQDVRMDAILTAAVVFAVWQWVEYLQFRRWFNFLFACSGMAIGFATKGAVGVVLPAMAVFFYLLHRRDWKQLFHPVWLLAGLIVLLLLSPVLYGFYQQFDLHPEKLIRGQQGISGLRFILLGQSLERFEGSSWGGGGGDPLFFLGTYLWAFLPWSLPGLAGLFRQLTLLIRGGFRRGSGTEALTAGTIIPFFLLISLAGYQLPHYINILLPYWAILTARYLENLSGRTARNWVWVQNGVTVLFMTAALALNLLAFPPKSIVLAAFAVVLCAVYIRVLIIQELTPARRIMLTGFSAAVFGQFLFNFSFYPQVLAYQAGHVLAAEYRRQELPADDVYFLDGAESSFSFEFGLGALSASMKPDALQQGSSTVYLYTGEEGISRLDSAGIGYDILAEAGHFHVSMLKPRFLNPATREGALSRHYIIEVPARPPVPDEMQRR
jgi:4-amino-4-deoxy-L-arabinose transferase-like glycosyltransferase